MNRREVLEIKKQLSPVNCNITRISMAHVTSEKEIEQMETKAFLSLSEEEAFKYFDLFKKSLSGKVGRALFNIRIPCNDKGIECQQYLLNLRNSKLQNEELLMEFYEKVAEYYDYVADYVIVLIHGMYDIPGKGSDDTEIEDASTDVYDYVHCIICPVEISKAGLVYDKETNRVCERIRDHFISMPLDGFLFPAFNDRNQDINGMLYYAKKAENRQEHLLHMLAATDRPMSASEEAELFRLAVAGNKPCSLQAVKDFFSEIVDLNVVNDGDTPPFTADDIEKLIDKSDMEEEQKTLAKDIMKEKLGKGGTVDPNGLMDANAFRIKTPSVEIKADPAYADRIETKMIGGKLCIALPLESVNVEVNGIDTYLCSKVISFERKTL